MTMDAANVTELQRVIAYWAEERLAPTKEQVARGRKEGA
jgi:hypothetical protein